MQSPNDISISKIIVEELFGYFTYHLPESGVDKDISRLFILYGDNGSGKTTILNLVFYLLSSKDKSGYKTKLARIKFKKFAIKLSNKIEIGANRDKDIIGSYTYYVKKGNRFLHKVLLKTTDDLAIRIKDDAPENSEFKAILEYIKKLDISIYFLSEDRKALDSQRSEDDERDFDLDIEYRLAGRDLGLTSRSLEKLLKKKRKSERTYHLKSLLMLLVNG